MGGTPGWSFYDLVDGNRLGESVQLLVQRSYLGIGEGFGAVLFDVGDFSLANHLDLALKGFGLVFGQLASLLVSADLDILLTEANS